METGETRAKIKVRPAGRGDVPLVLRFVRELAEYEKAPEQVVATEESLDRFLFGDGYGKGPMVEALIGEMDGRPEGFALFFSSFSTWLSTSGIYLEDLYVRPGARRCGLGRTLLQRLAEIAVSRGCGRLEWAVLNWNASAIEFYRSLGAKPMDEWTVFRLSGEVLRAFGSKEASGDVGSRI